MRILFTFAGGSGHFEPLLPIARAAEAAGHTVAFGGQPAMLPAIQAAGFAAFDTGGVTLGGAPGRLPLLKLDLDREDRDLAEGFAGRLAPERAAAILALAAAPTSDTCPTVARTYRRKRQAGAGRAGWQPDLLVCDEIDFGAMVAAERLGLPYAVVLVIAAGSFVRREVVGPRLNELRAAHGLPPDPDLAMLSRHLVLSPFPPGFRDPAFPLPATARSIRPLTPGRSARPPVPLAGAPVVYFTLGTVFNVESGDLFERVLAGLAGLAVNVIATVGRELDPAEFGPQPAHIQIARYIPQAALLPHCAAVISHGGSGSVTAALAHGLPLVLLPMGADQPYNAARCAALGAGRVLDAFAATPAEVAAAVTAVLADPAYRLSAQRLQAEIAALPPPESAVPLLEQLAARYSTA